MTDNNYPVEDGQLFDYSELIARLARVTNIESNYLELPDAQLNKQAIEDLFDLLLDIKSVGCYSSNSGNEMFFNWRGFFSVCCCCCSAN